MPVNERGEVRVMQNPGDPRVPEGVAIRPARRVLILGDSAALVGEGEYDEFHSLYENGNKPNGQDESEELQLTTRFQRTT